MTDTYLPEKLALEYCEQRSIPDEHRDAATCAFSSGYAIGAAHTQHVPVDDVDVVAWLYQEGSQSGDLVARLCWARDGINPPGYGQNHEALISMTAHQAAMQAEIQKRFDGNEIASREHAEEVARLRDDRDSHQRECIKALAGYDSLRGDTAALVKKCLDEERECWTGDSRQAVHLALDDAYARVLIALSQQAKP